jgi:hypothetical protein
LAEDDKITDADKLFMTLEMSPRFQNLLRQSFEGMPVEDWDDEYAITCLRAAFGMGLSAALKEPELVDALRALGFDLTRH